MRGLVISVDRRTSACVGCPSPTLVGDLTIACCGFASLANSPAGDIRFANQADLFANAYNKFGDQMGSHLLGEYCGVIVDAKRKQILLVQDSFGLRPLFYAYQGNQLLVASKMENLLDLIDDKTINEEYFRYMLSTAMLPYHATPWKKVHRLTHGKSALISFDKRPKIFQPWQPRYDDEANRHPDDMTDQFQQLLTDAVSATLVGSKNPCCELSGGLDSTSVLATAAHQRDVKALTIVSEYGSANCKDPFVLSAVEQFGVDWFVLDNDQHRPYSSIDTGFKGEPGTEAFNPNITAYKELLAKKGVDLLLTGNGGDVVFGGPDIQPHYLADELSRGQLASALRAIREHKEIAKHERSETHWLLHFALRSAWRHMRRKTFTSPGSKQAKPQWLNENFINCGQSNFDDDKQWAPKVKRPGAQYLWEEVYAQAAFQSTAFRLNSPFETRHPLFYRPLVEFMFALDDSYRRTGNADRILQREAMRGRIPELVRTRDSKGSAHRLLDRSLMENKQWLDMLTRETRLVEHGWVHRQSWNDAVDQARVGCNISGSQFGVAMSVECWLRNIENHRPLRIKDKLRTPNRLKARQKANGNNVLVAI